MRMVETDLETRAQAISEHASQILATSALVIGPSGVVIGSDQAPLIGERIDEKTARRLKVSMRVPAELSGSPVEVVLPGSNGREEVSERLVHELVGMLATQVAVDRLPNHRELRSRFVLDVLRGEKRDEKDVLRDAEVLGLDLSAVMLID